MSPGSRADQISAVREFNRFYTARLGLLRKRHLDPHARKRAERTTEAA